MTLRPVALRLRLAATLLGAALLCGAPLAVALLLQQRDASVQEASVAARRALAAAAPVIRQSCGASAECAGRLAQAAGLEWEPSPCGQARAALACVGLAGGSLIARADAAAALERARSRMGAVLAAVAVGILALVALLAVAFDRLFVRPLVRLDQAFDRLSVESDVPLPEAGDLLGRLAPSVRRLEERLREERTRVRTQLSELSQSNQNLREAREQAARSERLASVGRLAAGVAHELGNPVAAVLAYSSLLRAAPAPPEIAEYAARLEREALRMDRILHDLLDLARPRHLELAPIDVSRTVAGAWAHAGAEGSLELRNRLPPDLPAALGDEHYLVQVFVNLFTNAAKAGARFVEVRGRPDGERLELEVQDDGAGIAAEVFPHLFEPFFTTAAPGKGTGLGLALCHASLERMGGSIEARPSARGACFVLHMRRAGAG
ncbi:MAG TPA: ATP-binding protein [Myxococcales bacterium]|nr:ATP-binding protein [Myxococcales bacterium]